ncbi:DUF3102 domain-containing protein [Pediococcus stilesii]|uniref:DUF3102 domain-containing protein n=1 Tax=Pediococcus stilesii TaxID=331679 RepID=A0A5R9BUM8_9LACO|nr:DUF3102 domain-containing protein [Pediococcus stilesii]TLQ03780.1 DUF3102 domain-containing protein [Pediococcus stilesii]
MDELDSEKRDLESISNKNNVFEVTPLSDDLDVLEGEIHNFQKQGGKVIFGIGRRLNKIKAEDMAHGDWMDWLKKMNIEQTFANKSMQIARKFSNSNYEHAHNLESKSIRTLSELVTLPDSVLNETFALTEGEEEQSPFDMHSPEIRKLKRQLAQRDQQLKESQQQNRELEQRSPRVIEKIPDDYELVKNDSRRYKKLYGQSKKTGLKHEADLKKEIEKRDAIIRKKETTEEEVKKDSEELRELKKQLRNASDDVVAIDDLRQANEVIQKTLLEIASFIYSKAVERLDPDSFAAQHNADT